MTDTRINPGTHPPLALSAEGRIEVEHILRCPKEEAPQLAREVSLEQSVEVPEAVLQASDADADIVGAISTLETLPDDPTRHRCVISYRSELAANQLPQLINLIYGNISIKNNVRVVGLRLPQSFMKRFAGPRFGLAALRGLVGAHHRPLLMTAIKPRGSSPDYLLAIARNFALGGGDIIKDDHNLVDETIDAFKTRVRATQQVVNEVAQQTGRQTLYAPMVHPPAEQLDAHCAFLVEEGIRAMLFAPFIHGLDTMRRLSEQYPLAILAHPTFSGTFFHDPDHGVDPSVILGLLPRLAGADVSIFLNYTGRFSFTRAQCAGIVDACLSPWEHIAISAPCAGGGMTLDTLDETADAYGPDTIFLVGGALLGHSNDLAESTRAYQAKIAARFPH